MSLVHQYVVSCMVFAPLFFAVLSLFFPSGIAGHLAALAGSGLSLLASLHILWWSFLSASRPNLIQASDWIPQTGIRYIVGVDQISLIPVLLITSIVFLLLLKAPRKGTLRDRHETAFLLYLEGCFLGMLVSLDLALLSFFCQAVAPAVFLHSGQGASGDRIDPPARQAALFLAATTLLILMALSLGAAHKQQFGFRSFAFVDLYRLTTPLAHLFWPGCFLGLLLALPGIIRVLPRGKRCFFFQAGAVGALAVPGLLRFIAPLFSDPGFLQEAMALQPDPTLSAQTGPQPHPILPPGFAIPALALLSFAILMLSARGIRRKSLSFKIKVMAAGLIILAGMLLTATGNSLIQITGGFELVSIGASIIAIFWPGNRQSREGACKLFFTSSISIALVTTGLGILSSQITDPGSSALWSLLQGDQATVQGGGLASGAVALLISGLACQLALVPFHLWVPDAYEALPAAIVGLVETFIRLIMALTMIKASLILNSYDTGLCPAILEFLAWGSVFAGSVMALVQTSLKRFLAWTTIAQGGFLTIACCNTQLLNIPSPASVLYFGFSHCSASLLICAILASLEDQSKTNDQIDDLKGLSSTCPFRALALSTALISLAGISPTTGFFAKVLVACEALDKGMHLPVFVGMILTSLSALGPLRIIAAMYFSDTGKSLCHENPGLKGSFLPILLIPGLLGAGILLPGALVNQFSAEYSLIAQHLNYRRGFKSENSGITQPAKSPPEPAERSSRPITAPTE